MRFLQKIKSIWIYKRILIHLFKFKKLPTLLVELFSRTWELWNKSFPLWTIIWWKVQKIIWWWRTLTRYNWQNLKLKTIGFKHKKNGKCNNLNIWKHRMKSSILCRSLWYKIFLGLLMLWGWFMQKTNQQQAITLLQILTRKIDPIEFLKITYLMFLMLFLIRIDHHTIEHFYKLLTTSFFFGESIKR